MGLNFRQAEWVENRDWIYQVQLPDAWVSQGKRLRLRCAGLDYAGKILLNGSAVLSFDSAFTPFTVELKPHLKSAGNLLQVWFQPPPRWLRQFGYTSEMTEWKPRFYYSWDWVVRLVQTGVSDSVTLEVVNDAEIGKLQCLSGASLQTKRGSLRLRRASHDFGSFVLAKTGNLKAVMKAMGHGDVRSAMVYQHLEGKIIRNALNARHISGPPWPTTTRQVLKPNLDWSPNRVPRLLMPDR